MTTRSRSLTALPFLFALVAGAFFYFDSDQRLANHLAQVLADTSNGIVEVNGSGVIIGADSVLAGMVGYTKNELVGSALTKIMVAPARSKHPVDFANTQRAVTIVRCALLSKGGETVPVVIIARIAGGRYVATVIPENLVIDHFSK